MDINRLEFSQSIGIDTSVQVTDCFNEVMTIFNLVNKYDIESVKGNVNEGSISFDINFKNSSDADEVANIMVLDKLMVYEELYSLSNTRKKNMVSVSLTKL